MTTILEVRDLTRHYKQVDTVNGISFTVRWDTCFGLPVYKGSGKTTFKIVEVSSEPSSVEILYHGKLQVCHSSMNTCLQKTAPKAYPTTRKSLPIPTKNQASHTLIARLSQWQN